MNTTKFNGLPKWVRYRAAAYLRGKGLSFGVPSLIDGPLFPILAHEGTAFELGVNDRPHSMVVGEDLSIFADEKFDHIVVGDHPKRDELYNKLRVGGHLITINQDTILYPTRGSWQAKPGDVKDGFAVGIFKKLAGSVNNVLCENPTAPKRALIARYGAIGDALQLTPVIHQLYDDGYEVTLNVSPYTTTIYRNNPYVGNIVVQERNVIPNADLGDYWAYWQLQYDRYINFSESIEGKLLKVEGRSDFYTPAAWRRQNCQTNYHDQHMTLAGLEHSKYLLPEMYFSRSEEKDIAYEMRPIKDCFNIAWALKGSSHHKVYPFFPEVAASWLDAHPDSWILMVGGPESRHLQIKHPRAVPLAGEWDIRKSIHLTKHANLVIGPESAIINAASCFDTPKICLLSHSSKDNLTKYWTSNYSLEPDQQLAPCYPCHQLHYSLESCPIIDLDIDNRTVNNIPRCTAAITPSVLFNQIEMVYNKWLEARQVK